MQDKAHQVEEILKKMLSQKVTSYSIFDDMHSLYIEFPLEVPRTYAWVASWLNEDAARVEPPVAVVAASPSVSFTEDRRNSRPN